MISLSHLTYRYPGHAEAALSGVTLEVHPGEILGLLGPSGSGKSTLLKTALGLLPHFEGEVRLFGEPLEHTDQSRFERLGVLFEEPGHLGRLSVLENLTYFKGFYDRPGWDPEELLDRCGLSDQRHRPAGQLSRGLSQQLALARCLVHQPDLLLLDEPGAGLDPDRLDLLGRLLREHTGRGGAVLMTTHQTHWAQGLCSHVGFICAGQLKALGPLGELLGPNRDEVTLTYLEAGQRLQARFAFEGLHQNLQFLDLLAHPGLQSIHSDERDLKRLFKERTGRDLT
ncbi:MAG: ABC transporter ATP-binding protein [bacterium]|nr:ABC transporter ATP-binding protein [bacterium]